MKLTDKNPTIALTAVLICIIAGLGINSISQQTSQQSAERQVEMFKQLAEAKTDLRRAVVSHANYLLTGSKTQLDTFNESYNKFKTHLGKLREDPELSNRLYPLRNTTDSAIDDLRMSASVRKARGEDAARNMLATDRVADQIDEIDRALSDAEEYELGLVSLQVNGWKNAMSSVQWMIITVLLLCGFAYLSISRAFEPALKEEQEKNDHLSKELDAARKQLDRLANVDFLTEVLNMRGLEQVLAIEENRTGRAGGQCVAVLVNCDNFRRINETRGHAIGDAVLKEVAKRISGILRPSDRVARVGGDEFIIILIDTQLAFAMRVAERVRTTISESAFRPGGEVLNITVSLGVATLPLKFGTTEDVIALTRSALKRSKSAGRNRVSIARDGAGGGSEEVMSPRDIVEVLCDGAHFRTVFQPIVALGSEQISGYEIFTRGPDGAFESPAEFFRVCVENNILTAVDILCLKLAISTVADTTNMRFHINMFPSTLLDTQIENIIALFPPDKPGKFCIELSEEQFVGDPGYLREHVYALRQSGIMVAIDDIGFGRSSLESLILLEPDIVKIDRKYVTGVSKEPGKQRLLKRVVNVGKSLGAEVVAEGIENEEDLPILREIGIQYGQGYYWGELMEVLPTNLEARQAVKAEKR